MSTERSQLMAHVRAVWRRSQVLHLGAGVLALCRWAIPIFLVAIAIDRPAYLPAAVRGIILVALLGLALWYAWRAGWRRLRPFNATHVALQIEEKQGRLESLLVTAVQLGADEGSAASAALREQTLRLAEERAAPLRPVETVPYAALQRPGLIALALLAVIIVIGVVDGPFLKAGLQRIFTPWAAVEYPTDTHLAFREGDLVVRQGDEATIVAQVSGVLPEQARLSLKTGTGRPHTRPLDITNGVCTYIVASASRDFTYRIHAGDTRSDWRRVTVVPSPRVEKVNAVLRFPAYLQRAPETVSGLTLTVPEDTEIEWTLTMDRPLREARLLRDGEEPSALSVSADGRQVTLGETAKESRGFRFAWVERDHGFSFSSPRHYLQVAPDRPPRVELTRPAQNLKAILGRAVTFTVRARDDHGIAGAQIQSRVNLRPKKTEPITTAIGNGGGDQVLDWDYRVAVTNLQIGDTVAFTVEVSDHYAGPGGPHRARSDTRRITFLSREDYLAEIAKRKGRLLSRVRGVYRQQRAAHHLVLNLDPDDEAFEQTVQLESARQEMLRGQLNETVHAAQELIDDLEANGVADAPEGERLEDLRTRLQEIAETRIARAGELLRENGNPLSDGDVRDAGAAVRAIDLAARELGRLVLQRDIDSALEVFAREARAIAQNGAAFRRAAVLYDSGVDGAGTRDADTAALAALASEQAALAEWTRTLFDDLEAGMRYTKRPLAVLNLTRRIKDLRHDDVAAAMDDSAALLREGRVAEAMAREWHPMHALLEAETSVRRGVEYRTLLAARDQLIVIERKQTALLAAAGETDADDAALAQRQRELREDLAGLLLPDIPAPRVSLLDAALPPKPEMEKGLREAQRAMGRAAAHLAAGEAQVATAEQQAAGRHVAVLVAAVSDRTEESLVETAGFGRVAGSVSEWALRIADFETRQIGLLEEADIAAVDNQPCAPIAAAQQLMADDLLRFQRDIRRENELINLPERDLAPVLGRLDRALASVKRVLPHLRENQHDEAIEQQEQAADVLTDILERVDVHGERYSMLQSLQALERSVRKASRYVADIAAEQRDLMAVIDGSKPDPRERLVPAQRNLRRCIVDVAPLLDFVAGQLDVGTPLVFAGADMEDAVDALHANDREDALDALDAASDSLEEVAALIFDMSHQVGYVAEIVDFLHAACGDTGYAAFEQETLQDAITGEQAVPEGLAADQRALVARAALLDQQIAHVAGPVTNLVAAAPFAEGAAEGLAHGNRATSTEQMTAARKALEHNAAGLFDLVRVLYGLPKLPVTSMTSDAKKDLLKVLAVAGEHHVLLRRTQAAGRDAVGGLAAEQQQIAARCQAFGKSTNAHPKLVSAHAHLAKAAVLLKSASRAEALAAQTSAETDLRHFILEQALVLNTEVPPGPPPDPDAPASDAAETTGSDLGVMISAVGAFVSGEIPKDKRAEWEILQERGRAALHENFARELPLEYRGMLKSYFERVAK